MQRSIWLRLLTLVMLVLSACQPIQPSTNGSLPATGTVDNTVTTDLDMTAVLAPDRAVRIGQLENGLTYYIRHNATPAKRAEFWLVRS